jgi:hypothetical protein
VIVWVLVIGGFFAAFLYVVWRVSAGPSNQEPAIGNNLPGPSAEWGQFGLFPTLQGPELGTPESLVDGDPEKQLDRAVHREQHSQD